MSQIVLKIVCSVLISFLEILIFAKISVRKINFKNYKLYLSFILLVLLSLISFFTNYSFLLYLFNLIILFFINTILFEKNIKKSLIVILIYYFLSLIMEIILSTIMLKIEMTNHLEIIINVIIYLLIYLSLHIKLIRKSINHIILKYENYLYLFLIILFLQVFLLIYNLNNLVVLIIFTCISILLVCFLFLKNIIEKSEYQLMVSRYEEMLDLIKEYQRLIDNFRIDIHEQKNQLLVIRSLVKDKKTLKYLDEIIDNKKTNFNNFDLEKINYLNFKVIRGLLYYKISKIKEEKIKFSLDIDFEVRKISKLNNESDIACILGIFLDNAIEAALETESREINITINYDKNTLIFNIANTYKEIEIDRIYDLNYSTKGKNRGYGLVIAKERIEKNKNIKNKIEIIDDVFIQKLLIKCQL